MQWGVGGKCLGSLGARETCETEGACVERKNCIWRKLKPGFWHLKLKCFHRQIFNSFLAAESRLWERTRFGLMRFLGVTLEEQRVLKLMQGLGLAGRNGSGKEESEQMV